VVVARDRSLIVASHLEADSLAEHFFEGRDVPVRGPELELGITGRAEARQIVITARIQIDAVKRLRVTAIQSFGQTHHGRQHLDGLAQRPAQVAVAFV
jgi:hypothetical protein